MWKRCGGANCGFLPCVFGNHSEKLNWPAFLTMNNSCLCSVGGGFKENDNVEYKQHDSDNELFDEVRE